MLLALFVLAGCGGETSNPSMPGGHLPEFRLAGLDAQEVDSKGFAGRPLLINVWATWCEPCRREMAGLQRLSDRFSATGLQVVGITVDADLNLAREFLLQNGIRFLNLADPDQRLVRDVLNIKAFPHTLIVDRDGRVLESFAGVRDWSDMQRLAGLERLLVGKPDAPLKSAL